MANEIMLHVAASAFTWHRFVLAFLILRAKL